jgi:hypothetical protein
MYASRQTDKCVQEFLSRGDFEKAAKFFDKSLRLYPLPGVEALKQKAETLLRSRGERGCILSASL